MATGLVDSFREALGRAADALQPFVPALGGTSALTSLLPPLRCQALSCQPCLFSVGIALAEMWLEFGLQPAACFGHGVGEFVCAVLVLAGVPTLEQAAAAVGRSAGTFQQAAAVLCSGESAPRMAVLACSEQQARRGVQQTGLEAEDGVIDIAAILGPQQVVVSGSADALKRLVQQLKVPWRAVASAFPFHSAYVDAALASALHSAVVTPPPVLNLRILANARCAS